VNKKSQQRSRMKNKENIKLYKLKKGGNPTKPDLKSLMEKFLQNGSPELKKRRSNSQSPIRQPSKQRKSYGDQLSQIY